MRRANEAFREFYDKLTIQMDLLEQDISEHVPLEIVRDETLRRKGGRPTVLTKRLFIKICHLIERGSAITAACDGCGVSYGRFRIRVSQSPRLQQRLKEAEAVRSSVRHEQALAAVIKASDRNFIAAAWLLERCWPELYALRKVDRPEIVDKLGKQPIEVIGVSAAEIEKYVGPEYQQLPNGNVSREVGGIKVVYARLT